MQKHITQLYLASTSPRRRELLQQLGVIFEVVAVDIDESIKLNETAQDYVCRMALEKARLGCQLAGKDTIPVLGSDTSVVLANNVFGKPQDKQQSSDMLMSLSGKTHEVLTAVALIQGDHEKVILNTSQVTFKDLSETEIEAYWESGEPVDKAGSYAIQGKGAKFIKHLSGSFSGVMGLPLYETAELLTDFGVKV